MTTELPGVALIALERNEQLNKHGFTAEHDDNWTEYELLQAAVRYIEDAVPDYIRTNVKWPWAWAYWNPGTNRIETLVKAGALIAAEIDRLQRIENSEEQDS